LDVDQMRTCAQGTPKPEVLTQNAWFRGSQTSAASEALRHNAFHLAFRRTAQKYREMRIVGIGDGFTWNDRVSVGAKIGKCDHVRSTAKRSNVLPNRPRVGWPGGKGWRVDEYAFKRQI
jgi:hypothetical protein